MKTLLVITTLIPALCLAWEEQEPQVLYETFPHTTVPNISKPRIYIDQRGNGYKTFRNTTVPDYSKPVLAPITTPRNRYERPDP